MRTPAAGLLFDKRDHALIRIVNRLHRTGHPHGGIRGRFYPVFHPNGIKELAESKSLRIAYAVAHLLDSLEVGAVEQRINALRMVRAEAIDTADGPMPLNTARVLLQLMKELVRADGDYQRQLMLAHDFRIAAGGNPRVIRRQLKRFHLLEMPEAWNQVTFDDHVHDATSKGRKTPTHLIMDAWIKGIRRLRVIHYNCITSRVAAELFSAARILGLDVRVGIEFNALYRNKFVQLIWVPRGFADPQDFLCFLADPKVMRLMEEGQVVSAYQQQHVMTLLRKFNTTYLPELVRTYDLPLSPIDEKDFLKFVGIGQKSKLHLSEYIQNRFIDALRTRLRELRRQDVGGSAEARKNTRRWIETMNRLDIEATVKRLLSRENNPEIHYPDIPPADIAALPPLMALSPAQVLERLAALRSGYHITLNLTDLRLEEVLELLYDCQGAVTRLEIFNLKDHAAGKTRHLPGISRLQEVINTGSIISLKQTVQGIMDQVAATDLPDKQDRLAKLGNILYDLATLKRFYHDTPLEGRIGSDSTGRSFKVQGMGMAVKETLPLRTQRELHHKKPGRIRFVLPVHITVYPRHTFKPRRPEKPLHPLLYRLALAVPPTGRLFFICEKSWQVASAATRMVDAGNVVTLGGTRSKQARGYGLEEEMRTTPLPWFSWRYLKTRLKNPLKIGFGFIPAFLTFYLTKDWWVLAWLGAPIWFAVTGLRNIIQSVLGGGGWKRSPLMRWNNTIRWDRITDSLLYTGFSVPLLDYLIKTVILDNAAGITTANHPVLLYTFMAMANGVYLMTHNLMRGLPRTAAYTNLFRSILSVPVAVCLNASLAGLLAMAGVAAPQAGLQKWAAIISKTASDFVAGIIEGIADRYDNIRARLRDYRQTFDRILDVYSQLELLHPEVTPLNILEAPATARKIARAETTDLEQIIMVHALDLLYFWMYQPRARIAFKRFVRSLPEDERQIMVGSQFTLTRHHAISRLFLDGMLGESFQKALAFYLARYEAYLEEIKQLGLDGASRETGAA